MISLYTRLKNSNLFIRCKSLQNKLQTSLFRFDTKTLVLALVVSDATVFDFVQKNNFEIQKIQNSLQAQQASLLSSQSRPFNWTLVSDITTTKDRSKSLPAFTKSDTLQHSGNIQLNRKWTIGLDSFVKYSHLQSSSSGGYGSNVWSVGLEKEVFPSLNNSSQSLSLMSAEADYKASQVNNEFLIRSVMRSQLDVYGKLQLMLIQIKLNQTLLEKYDRIVKTVQRKKNNNFAVAGELEQATAEMKTREISLKELQQNYNSILESFLEDNNIYNQVDVTIAEPDFALPEKINKIVLSEKFPAEQHRLKALKSIKAKSLALEATELDLQSSQDSSKPVISLFATYNTTGLDPSLAESFKQSQKTDTDKYSVGIKLVHEFDSPETQALNAYKQSAFLLNRRIKENAESRVVQQIELARMDLKLALDQLEAQTEILNLRRKAVDQITQNYNQGRIDISLLFDAYNKSAQSEISRTDALNTLRLKKYDFETTLLTE